MTARGKAGTVAFGKMCFGKVRRGSAGNEAQREVDPRLGVAGRARLGTIRCNTVVFGRRHPVERVQVQVRLGRRGRTRLSLVRHISVQHGRQSAAASRHDSVVQGLVLRGVARQACHGWI